MKQNILSLLFFLLCLGGLLRAGTELALVHPLDTELAIGLERLHLLSDLHELN